MTASLLGVFGLALVDSINPSALGVTLYLLLSGKSARPKVLVYIAGVFLSYFSIGILFMLGLESIQAYLQSSAAYAVQGVIGALLLIYGVLAPSEPRKRAQTETRAQPQSLAGLFLLGITVTVLEFATALPYLGAIGLLTAAELSVAQWLPILFAYNVIFILPPIGLLVAYSVFGERLEKRFANWQERLKKEARVTWLWIAAIVGFFLLADSLRYFEFFGLIDIPTVLQNP
jgi:cytochrome c biogenesis protein CcdA